MPNDVTRFSICGTLIFSSIVTMKIEILKIDREANKQDIEAKLPGIVIATKKLQYFFSTLKPAENYNPVL